MRKRHAWYALVLAAAAALAPGGYNRRAMADKTNKVKAQLLKGMQDSWPRLTRARRAMLQRIEPVCQRFGFLPFDTPALEAIECILGPNPTPAQLHSVFAFKNQDDELVGLRYEHTGPLARVVSQYQLELARPFRRYAVGPVWRYDKPEPGRFREFYQFDVDTVGAPGMAADAEIIALLSAIFTELDIPNYEIRLSNRKLLNALGEYCGADPEQGRDIYRVIDKLDKFDRERIRLELGPGLKDESGDPIRGLGLTDRQIGHIDEFLDLKAEAGNVARLAGSRKLLGTVALAAEGLDELEQVLDYAAAFGVSEDNLVFDPHLARGLGYYSGPVFEVVLRDASQFGSVFGGGRYDGLLERFLGPGQGVPATGASVGVDRLLAALAALRGEAGEHASAGSQVLVTVMDKARMQDYIAIACELRNAGIPAEVYLGGGNVGKQLKYADRLGIPLAVIMGGDEFAAGSASVKDLELGRRIAAEAETRAEWAERPQQFTCPRGELTAQLKARLV
jgi:histidyl-tRNA synthetase